MTYQIMEQKFWANSIFDYLVALLIFLISVILIKMFKRTLLKHLKIWTKKTATTLDDFLLGVIERIFLPLSFFAAFYLSVNILSLNPLLKRLLDISGIAILTYFVTRVIVEFVDYGFNVYWLKQGKGKALELSLKGILNVIRVVIWGLAIVFFLDNLGFKISSVIAGLGIGGVAVALAAQAVLKDLFSYFSIIFDHPFEVGDFIIIGDYLGTIEHIGIKTTRIRSLGGEQLVFSNSDLTDSRLRNYKRMQKRRVVFRFGVTYQTSIKKLREIPAIAEEAIKKVKDTVFDRAHFSSFADSSLLFEVVYYVIGSDYNKYMDIQQVINFGIKENLENQGVEFAYPTQTIYLAK